MNGISENALGPIVITESGITSAVRPVHSMKAPSPILVTEPGITTEVRPVHSKKAPSSILVTLSGISTINSFSRLGIRFKSSRFPTMYVVTPPAAISLFLNGWFSEWVPAFSLSLNGCFFQMAFLIVCFFVDSCISSSFSVYSHDKLFIQHQITYVTTESLHKNSFVCHSLDYQSIGGGPKMMK